MARIQLRRDTTANWTAQNPVLAEGEQGLDTTTGLLYVGDGVTAFAQLTPFTGDNSGVYTKAESDVLLAAKADTADTYTKAEVDANLTNMSRMYYASSAPDAVGRVNGDFWYDSVNGALHIWTGSWTAL